MKKVSLIIAGMFAVSTAIAAEQVEVKQGPVEMTKAEMQQIVAGSKQNNWSFDTSGCSSTGNIDCNPSGKQKTDWNNKGN